MMLLVFLSWAHPLLAADIYWAAPVSGAYATSGNWNPATVPGQSDFGRFNLGSAGYTVSLPVGTSIELTTFDVQNDTVTFDGQQGTSAFIAYVGDNSGDGGNLTFTDGIAKASTTIGNQAGSKGTLIIDGSQAASWIDGTATVGNAGSGTLHIIDGGSMIATKNVLGATSTGVGEFDVTGINPTTMLPSRYSGPLSVTQGTGTINVTQGGLADVTTLTAASVAGSTATLNIDGKGSDLNLVNASSVGSNGTAYVNVSGGGEFTSVANIGFAGNTGGHATIDVSGVGSLLSGPLATGAGTATITIENGGAIQSENSASLATSNSGTTNVTLTGSGSSWTGQNFALGSFGTGTMTVEAGAQGSFTGTTNVGSQGIGQLTVTGSGSQWTTGTLGLATSGSATMTVEKAATVGTTSGVVLASNPGSTASLTVDGGGTTLTASAITVGIRGNGAFSVTNGGVVNVSGTTQVNGGQGSIHISGAGSELTTAALSFGGAGSLTIDTAAVVNASSLGLGSVANSTTDSGLITGLGSQLNVSGDAAIGTGSQGTFVVNQAGVLTIGGNASVGAYGLPGNASVDGAGSQWKSASLTIGIGGQGSMNVTNAGTVSTGYLDLGSGASGSLTVSGTGSQVSTTGDATIGLATQASTGVSAGGTVSIGGVTYLGENSQATSSLSIDGSGSSWTSGGQIVVGWDAPGTVNVTGGALLSTKAGGDPNGYSAIIGEDSSTPASSVTVSGAGSHWTQDGTVVVGENGQGSLSIQGGGVVTSAGGIVSLQGRATSQVLVSDPGSAWNISGPLSIGGTEETGRGIGQMTIQNQGVVTSTTGTIGTLESSNATGFCDCYRRWLHVDHRRFA